jgi:hypothetical protein
MALDESTNNSNFSLTADSAGVVANQAQDAGFIGGTNYEWFSLRLQSSSLMVK